MSECTHESMTQKERRKRVTCISVAQVRSDRIIKAVRLESLMNHYKDVSLGSLPLIQVTYS